MSNIIILAAIILYLGMVVWIGVICSKKNSDVGDFYLGGRKLGPVVTAMSAEASDMSSYLLMGVPGLAYLTGLADATWTAIGLALGTIFCFSPPDRANKLRFSSFSSLRLWTVSSRRSRISGTGRAMFSHPKTISLVVSTL